MSEFSGMTRINERKIVGVMKRIIPTVTIEYVTDFAHPRLDAAGLDFRQSIPMQSDEVLRHVVTNHTRPSARPIKTLMDSPNTWGWMFDSACGEHSASSLFACLYTRDIGRRIGRMYENLADSGGEGFHACTTFSRGHFLVIQASLLKTIIGRGDG